MWFKMYIFWIFVDVAVFSSTVLGYNLGYCYIYKGKWRFKVMINVNRMENILYLILNICIF